MYLVDKHSLASHPLQLSSKPDLPNLADLAKPAAGCVVAEMATGDMLFGIQHYKSGMAREGPWESAELCSDGVDSSPGMGLLTESCEGPEDEEGDRAVEEQEEGEEEEQAPTPHPWEQLKVIHQMLSPRQGRDLNQMLTAEVSLQARAAAIVCVFPSLAATSRRHEQQSLSLSAVDRQILATQLVSVLLQDLPQLDPPTRKWSLEEALGSLAQHDEHLLHFIKVTICWQSARPSCAPAQTSRYGMHL